MSIDREDFYNYILEHAEVPKHISISDHDMVADEVINLTVDYLRTHGITVVETVEENDL